MTSDFFSGDSAAWVPSRLSLHDVDGQNEQAELGRQVHASSLRDVPLPASPRTGIGCKETMGL